jgi:hypothetical protein
LERFQTATIATKAKIVLETKVMLNWFGIRLYEKGRVDNFDKKVPYRILVDQTHRRGEKGNDGAFVDFYRTPNKCGKCKS